MKQKYKECHVKEKDKMKGRIVNGKRHDHIMQRTPRQAIVDKTRHEDTAAK